MSEASIQALVAGLRTIDRDTARIAEVDEEYLCHHKHASDPVAWDRLERADSPQPSGPCHHDQRGRCTACVRQLDREALDDDR